MESILKFLAGKKTHAVAILAALAGVAQAFGWLTADQVVTIDAILAPLGLAFLRMGIKKEV